MVIRFNPLGGGVGGVLINDRWGSLHWSKSLCSGPLFLGRANHTLCHDTHQQIEMQEAKDPSVLQR